MNRHVLIVALLIVATLAVFFQVHSFDFINYDDEDYILNNPQVAAGLSSDGIRWAFTAEKSATWQPLTWISLMSDVDPDEIDPGRFHVHNLVLHLLNALLLYALLWFATRSAWPAAWVAVLFAIHPLHVESVAWITERKDVLSTFWGLISLIAYVRYARSQAKLDLIASALAMALGLMAKPMLVTWPAVMLLLDAWPLKRWRLGAARESGDLQSQPLSKLIIEKIPFFALSLASSFIAYRVQSGAAAVTGWDSISLGQRLSNALVSYARYLGMTFWPSDFSVLYPHPNLSGGTPLAAWQVGGALLLVLGITALVLILRRHRYLAVGWFWFLGTLVPVIGLVQIGTHAMADRFTYVPLIGIFIALAWLLQALHRVLVQRRAQLNWMMPAVAALLALAVLLPARSLTAKWSDSATLYEYSLQSGPGSPKLHYNLGLAYSTTDRQEEAVVQYRRAIELQPHHNRAWNNLGRSLGILNRFEESEAAFQEALRLRPELKLPYINYAKMLERAGRRGDAITQRKLALERQEDFANVNHIGALLAQEGRIEEAVSFFRRAVQLEPRNNLARTNLQNAQKLLEQGARKK